MESYEKRIPTSLLDVPPNSTPSNRIKHLRAQDSSREIESEQPETFEKHTIYSTICNLGLVAQSVEQRIENVEQRTKTVLHIGSKHSKTHCPLSTESIGSQRFQIFPEWHRQL